MTKLVQVHPFLLFRLLGNIEETGNEGYIHLSEVIHKFEDHAKLIGKGDHAAISSVEFGEILKQTFPLLKKARKSIENKQNSDKEPSTRPWVYCGLKFRNNLDQKELSKFDEDQWQHIHSNFKIQMAG